MYGTTLTYKMYGLPVSLIASLTFFTIDLARLEAEEIAEVGEGGGGGLKVRFTSEISDSRSHTRTRATLQFRWPIL